jgi:FKBP-type peptidyl-prolyl cis-trans isomerase SlyD
MEGKVAGDIFSVTVPPEEAYGMRQEGAAQRVPIKHLQGARKWRPGMIAHVQTDQGMKQVQVVKVGRFMADVDTNHPLAGKTLTFDIEVVDVREATAEEIAHGHAHGVGGHHH